MAIEGSDHPQFQNLATQDCGDDLFRSNNSHWLTVFGLTFSVLSKG